ATHVALPARIERADEHALAEQHRGAFARVVDDADARAIWLHLFQRDADELDGWRFVHYQRRLLSESIAVAASSWCWPPYDTAPYSPSSSVYCSSTSSASSTDSASSGCS